MFVQDAPGLLDVLGGSMRDRGGIRLRAKQADQLALLRPADFFFFLCQQMHVRLG